ncbi:la-related protein 6A [Prunus yedoensis var. nudiflora]|uniref:La-related protein 6A n=1 Tax=Prunus yedoensis var. nudiflora TaxID=2094558 RepID=A0A314ZQF1_PRUYE|nr:la-related protein 6A [Prunus yedoensis var. nudiflora]
MEGEEGPTVTVTAPTTTVVIRSTDSPPPSPTDGSDVSPVESPDRASSEIQPQPSDDDPDQSSGTGGLSDDLKQKIIKQVEYYFSDENLPTDKHMLSLIKKNKEGFVPISVIASFRKMKKLIRNNSLIAAALRESSLLVVSSNGKKLKRLHPLPLPENRDAKCTVLVENLPEDHSVENLKRIFGEAGNIKDVCILDPHAIEASTKGGKAEKLISNKLHALVEYDTVEAADKAVTTLNNEEDWRNGMRVKHLKQMGKYGQRKQAWRGFDSEKSSGNRTSDQTGGEENHNASEHHNDTRTPDDEDGERVPKEKTGHRGRTRGQSGRQKYRVTNGFGHGTSSANHGIEPSKPPPGPRMPDGTRGFTMGRGRTLSANSNQS